MDSQSSWSDRTEKRIHDQNAYAARARKLGVKKKDDPETHRIHEELRKASENLDRILAQMGDIPLFKLPAGEKELDKIVRKFSVPPLTRSQKLKPTLPPPPVKTDQTQLPQRKKTAKRTRDVEEFIFPPKHLTRKAPKANKESQIKDVPATDPKIVPGLLKTPSNVPNALSNTPLTGTDAPGILRKQAKAQKGAEKTQKSKGNGSAKQSSEKQPPPPPRPDVSEYRKVEPTLQYAAALQGKTYCVRALHPSSTSAYRRCSLQRQYAEGLI
ncbi:hypothetical protein NPIL_631611 [Nephila pilipes]|uniref:Uncharacterized protein n=1 Tax=Nephila pilipes TaxID=299642 RepID=A0A8X6UHQ4_NEPPI|nr:hypothetical protein NPIL_631611 [Nephila pilipes]